MKHIVLLQVAQISATVQSDFLSDKGSVYKLSPVYTVKTLSPDDRFQVSGDGKRVAYVSLFRPGPPQALEQDIANGRSLNQTTQVGVWSRETGQVRTLLQAKSPSLGVDALQFVGHDVVFTTFDESREGPVYKLWIARDGGIAEPVEVPGYEGAGRLLVAPDQAGFLLAGQKGVWLFAGRQSGRISLPEYDSFIAQGLHKDGRAVVYAARNNGTSDIVLVDFETGATTTIVERDHVAPVISPPPFILDAYKVAAAKDPDLAEESRSREVDDHYSWIAEEDGGWLVDLVEPSGDKRRRVRLTNDAARGIRVSRDGLTFAFVSNRTLMVRGLVKLGKEAASKLLTGQGG